jgi:hypothetical protein
MTRLGFRPTPRGIHSAKLGTHNATIVLPDRTTYFEVLGIRSPTDDNAAMRAGLEDREGAAGLAFKTTDAQAAAGEFAAAALAAGPAIEFDQPVELPHGMANAAFTVARLTADATPGAFSFVCQHFTPEVVWRDDYVAQPNGAVGLTGIVGVVEDPASIAGAWQRVFGERLRRDGDDVVIDTGTAAIRWTTRAGLERTYGAFAAALAKGADGPRVLQVRSADLDATRHVLGAAGIATIDVPGGFATDPAAGCGTIFAFHE